MSVKPKIYLYLVHQENGQRYPVGEEVVIGRTGDICFPDDAKMSSQHCRIIKTPQGTGIHDLGSANGTWLDGIKLSPNKMYVLKAGATIAVANQIFKTVQPSLAKKIKPRRKKPKKRGFDFVSATAGAFALFALGLFGYLLSNHSPPKGPEFAGQMLTPYQIVEKEMKTALAEYAELGQDHSAKRINNKQLSDGIRKNLIPKLTSAHAKMLVLRPQSEFEKRKISANDKLLTALLGQVDAMALYAVTKDPKLAPEIERLGALAAQANQELEKIEASRAPARYDY